ncbi:prepilin-type N-terminal cleavage/methylation domain-containing protein [Maridesulfovibrio sp.]|uniref:PulJ/GspJ family protein n=1 Tax=Maridesulfovibrio sp. TaxID=2795000 RepID=UPI0029CAA0F5|nr:prepilin-type N-terminal cleavage/methylation domain-containing protein [Maridesulfovibrio sp.]
MISFQRHHSPPECQGGFSLIEVLIGLVLSGLLMSMVAMVLGQSITNNEVVRSSSGLSARMFTLRRILHRDLQNILPGTSVSGDGTSLTIATNNCIFKPGVGTVTVTWDFSSSMIRRKEISDAFEFENSYFLMRGLDSWTVEFLDGKNDVWNSARQQTGRGLTGGLTKALRMKMRFDDGQDVTIVERIPYATE